MSVFLKPRDPKAFEEALNAAQTPGELRQAALNALRKEGQIIETMDQEFNERLVPYDRPAAQPAVSLPASSAPPTHMRVIYPWSNSRFELVGSSEEDLDQQEARIRQMYSGR